jgi:Ca2+/Na+ antiporter
MEKIKKNRIEVVATSLFIATIALCLAIWFLIEQDTPLYKYARVGVFISLIISYSLVLFIRWKNRKEEKTENS